MEGGRPGRLRAVTIPRRLSIEDAAAALGVSVSTVRRRIRAGRLAVEREATPQGFRYWVTLEGGESSDSTRSKASVDANELAALTAERDWLRARVEALELALNREQETALRLSQALGQRPATLAAAAEPMPPMAEPMEPPQTPATSPQRRSWLPAWPWRKRP
jgi:hypothetical protein